MHRFVLIRPDNTTRTYHLRDCAEIYQNIYGGYLIDVFLDNED
jgi:hypothetical protein